MKKRFVTLLLSVLLVALCAANAFAADFQDVPENSWYAESVRYVSENGIMRGTGENTFDPDGTITRGMVVTILYRIEKTPEVSGISAFADVEKDAYYANAVAWAADKGIVNGYSAAQFGPNDSITREQFAAILYRYCTYQQGDISANGSLNQYKDAGEISDYAKTAMLWANVNGLITGTSATALSPQDTATRAQAATIVMRYLTNAAVEEPAVEEPAAEEPATEEPTTEEPATEEPVTEEPASEEPVTKESIVEENLKEQTPFAQPSEDSDNAILTVDTVSANAGDGDVTVNICVRNNPGILGLSFSLTFDETDLTLIGAENGSAFKDSHSLLPPAALKSQCRFIWYAESVDEQNVADGCVLTLHFRVSERAAGRLPISIHVLEDDAFDNDLNTVTVEIHNGSIDI